MATDPKDDAIDAVKAVNAPTETIVVPLKQIVADDAFNVRRKIDESIYAKLRDDIKINGLTNPLVVRRRDDGKYALIAGFTRYRALKEIEKDAKSLADDAPPVNVRVTIKEYASDVDAHYDNVRDNMLRGTLSPYDIAIKARYLRDEHQQKGSTIAKGVGLDKDYCNNLMRTLDKLDPRIIDQWAAGNEFAATAFLFSILTKDHDEQWERWLKRTGEWRDPEEATDEGDDEGSNVGPGIPAPGPSRPKSTVLEAALDAVKASDKSDEWKEGAVNALKFALGQRKTLPGVYDPKKSQIEGGRAGGRNRRSADAEA